MATLKIPNYLIETIEEFLKNRSFFVQINNYSIDRRPIQWGVPQGGVLSPTLFNINVNDLPMRNSGHIKSTENDYYVLFADDLAYICTFKDKEVAEALAQIYLCELERWTNNWRLELAPHKF